jgi:hypothetical protein
MFYSLRYWLGEMFFEEFSPLFFSSLFDEFEMSGMLWSVMWFIVSHRERNREDT